MDAIIFVVKICLFKYFLLLLHPERMQNAVKFKSNYKSLQLCNK